MTETLLLPAKLDLKAAETLKADILARRGGDLTLDGSAVERLGGLGLQVLLAARKTWAADGLNLSLVFVSEALREQWAAFGAPDFDAEGARA